LLLDYWPLQRTESAWKLVLEKLPLLALSAAACLATVLAQTKLILPAGLLSLPLRFANAVVSCMVYLGQMVWPLGLAAYYPYPYQGPPGWEVAAGLTLLAGVSVLALWRRRKQPWILAGWLWYLVMLLPVMGLIQVGRQAHADRYTYLPQIGVYVALTWLVAGWRASRLVLGSLMAGVLAVLMVCASKQTAYWKDNETLWVHALACTTANDVAHFNLGNALRKEGRVDEATSHYQQAVQINPNYAEARFNLGTALFKKGSLDEAILQYQAALQIKPDYAKAHYNLGNALFKKGNVDGAVTEYQTALQIQPDYADAFNNLGNVLLQNARVDEAISQYQRALQINPTNARFHVNLGAALLQKGRMEETVAHFQKALQIEPANPEVQNNLAWILATGPQTPLRNGARALELANQANALTQGTDPVILHTLAAALAETGRFNDARRTAQKAIELARAAGQQELLDELNGELKRYSAGLPCHD
jgi:Flp pilus assembly protein TadD